MDRLADCLIVGRMDPVSAIPESFTAGTTLKLRRTHSSYPASDGWTMQFYLAGAQVATVAGVAAGDSFDVTLPAATTAPLPPGMYRWVERVSKAGETYDAATGLVTLNRNLAAAGAGDAQSWEEKAVVVLQASISGTLEDGMSGYQIAGRSVQTIPLEEQMKLLAQLTALIRRRRSGGRIGRQHLINFLPPGGA